MGDFNPKYLVYCYNNMIDVSNITLSKAEDYNK